MVTNIYDPDRPSLYHLHLTGVTRFRRRVVTHAAGRYHAVRPAWLGEWLTDNGYMPIHTLRPCELHRYMHKDSHTDVTIRRNGLIFVVGKGKGDAVQLLAALEGAVAE